MFGVVFFSTHTVTCCGSFQSDSKLVLRSEASSFASVLTSQITAGCRLIGGSECPEANVAEQERVHSLHTNWNELIRVQSWQFWVFTVGTLVEVIWFKWDLWLNDWGGGMKESWHVGTSNYSKWRLTFTPNPNPTSLKNYTFVSLKQSRPVSNRHEQSDKGTWRTGSCLSLCLLTQCSEKWCMYSVWWQILRRPLWFSSNKPGLIRCSSPVPKERVLFFFTQKKQQWSS